ncbi:hypothetical protein BEWA_008980 [Theileria equi strain WA]|uniref:ribonuclease Z n=1 Tax=Theileria equi strain WA TaxID=1537102 RepID=L0B2P2_THEEQ|nr:hypothetical protein BEWA_008980 [Theileria equi strain WA]AFZ81486.1 hypothetical protein BEWA_008980 [Theileria equi strain WA]|eukprot:XP_004831152.1 hypothetical protein BEWA_008980 [Theileria equi strain WA]
MELGVPKGPEFGRLKKGHSVQLPNGQMVHSSQVCGEGLEGTRVLITDCKAEEVSLYLERAKLDIENIYYIFYLADPGNVPENLKHVLCDQTYGNRSYIPLYPSACRNYAYNETFPHAFPKPIECRGFYPDRNLKGHSYPPLTKFYMHPINSSIDTTEVLRETFEDDMIKYSDIENVKKSKDSLPCTWESTDEYRFIFLGTGCSYPSVYRNVSAILLHMKNNSFLFDAGEGTILQLLRSSSDHKDFVSKLISIRTIFISHSHADHHLGLYSLLAMQEHYRRDAMDDSVTTVIAPKTVYKFLTQYKERIMDINYDFVYTGNSQVSVNGFLVDMFNVIHIEDSFGVKVSHPEIGKVVYSGDTRPCENLIRYAQGVDFLIHEATFTECDFDNAVKSNHSTFLEALEIAKKCSVKTLILTHFSQRYQELGDARYNAILAHDLMSIPLKCGHNS